MLARNYYLYLRCSIEQVLERDLHRLLLPTHQDLRALMLSRRQDERKREREMNAFQPHVTVVVSHLLLVLRLITFKLHRLI